ncbi:MAG: phosphoglucosamine mutase, partial [Bryobacteraceae bacterium]
MFGTDGIRGTAGAFPLDPDTVHAFGIALARSLSGASVVIGMDTRASSPTIAAQVSGGLAAGGAAVRFAGVTTTPGVAFLARSPEFAAGVMISASHNPFPDNGLKVFGHSGYKLPDIEEHAIEERIFALLDAGVHAAPCPPPVDEGLDRLYVDDLLSTGRTPLSGLRVVLDCGNGAASALAPDLFRRAGAAVEAIHCSPDGSNINLDCGALHVESLQRAVLGSAADLGVAFDGDADRAI